MAMKNVLLVAGGGCGEHFTICNLHLIEEALKPVKRLNIKSN
jgi:hypothetical protein